MRRNVQRALRCAKLNPADARKAGARAERQRFKEQHADEIAHHVNLNLAKRAITPSKRGLAHEQRLAESLRAHFPQYRVEKHGQRADVHLMLGRDGVEFGRIVAEERRQKRITEPDVLDANFRAGKARNASFKVLVTTAMEITIARRRMTPRRARTCARAIAASSGVRRCAAASAQASTNRFRSFSEPRSVLPASMIVVVYAAVRSIFKVVDRLFIRRACKGRSSANFVAGRVLRGQ